MRKTLAIVGAGAKAAAVAARAAALRAIGGRDVPEIIVFEAEGVGAAWSGDGGFSSGFLTLCTPGEKDVGFPYDERASRGGHEPIAPIIFGRFSWAAFQVATGNFSDWVDRGRGHPSHRAWAEYLTWVMRSADQEVVRSKVTAVRPEGDRWRIEHGSDLSRGSTLVDGVLLTGTGRARAIPASPGTPAERMLDTENFWRHRKLLLERPDLTVAVAGDGGAAGAVVAWLVEQFAERQSTVVSISPMGTLFPRGDGHAERRWFSDPTDWRELSVEHRRKLLERTEAGVVSLRNKQLIDQSIAVAYRRGRVLKVDWTDEGLDIDIEYDGQTAAPHRADYLVAAIGFDNWSLLDLVDHSAAERLRDPSRGDERKRVEEEILPDYGLPPSAGLPPGLHVPALAGLAHGPGIGNLGCLGLMAASILRPYLA
ncbi:SidA/IucD/PvdA family monooxygenase [Lichenibacterium dinghuense]|uniref:SidA/IucD/PvdA family monooxygenase n=1 Tax=Lichenibacterium dinghuense TaxID=2895977 RepID=UPI001F27CE06|nr:SidA/IucD/PvdA family monooxygenase [Lichenibacterium sp. 6Y81]